MTIVEFIALIIIVYVLSYGIQVITHKIPEVV